MVAIIPFCDTGNESEARERFADFFALGPVLDTTKIHPYTRQNEVNNRLVVHGPRSYVKVVGYRILSPEILQYSHQKFSEYVSYLGGDYEISSLIFESYPTAKRCEVAPDATAFASREDHIHCVLNMRWKSSSHDAWVAQWIREFAKRFREIDRNVCIERGKVPLGIVGYANSVLPGERAEELFRGNFQRMREVKKKWDPNQRFNKWLPIPPT